jgi:hypothetical protein
VLIVRPRLKNKQAVSAHSSIVVILKVVTGNLFVSNARMKPISSMYGEASSFDSSAYFLQRDRSKVLDILMLE